MADPEQVNWNEVNDYILYMRSGKMRGLHPPKEVAVKVAEMTGLPFDLAYEYVKLTRSSPSVEIRGYQKRKPWNQNKRRRANALPPSQDPSSHDGS